MGGAGVRGASVIGVDVVDDTGGGAVVAGGGGGTVVAGGGAVVVGGGGGAAVTGGGERETPVGRWMQPCSMSMLKRSQWSSSARWS